MRAVLRGSSVAVGSAVVLAVWGSLASAEDPLAPVAEPQLRLAVATFESPGSPAGRALAEALAGRLASRPGLRVVGVGQLPEHVGPETEPRVVRRVAFALGLDALVVGRVDAASGHSPAADDRPGRTITLRVRSGHSGGTLASHRAVLVDGGDPERVAEPLAESIASDLGWVPPVPAPPPVSAAGGAVAGASGRAGEKRSPLFAFGTAGAADPIEIEAEELEFIALDDGGRRLLFSRGVRVVQGDVTLLADELEALYAERDSQPSQLLARGHVRIRQGDRSARCQRAAYVRSEQVLRCSGRAELISGCDVVRGRSIEFDLERDSARVVGAASVLIRPKSGPSGGGCAERDG